MRYCVHLGSLDSSGCALGSRVHSGSLGSFVCTKGVFGLILGRCVHVEGDIRVRPWVSRVHSGSPQGSPGSFGIVRFIRVHPGCCRIYSGSLGLFGCTVGVVGFILGRPSGHQVHSRSFGSLGCTLVVVGFIRGRWVYSGAPWV